MVLIMGDQRETEPLPCVIAYELPKNHGMLFNDFSNALTYVHRPNGYSECRVCGVCVCESE